MRKGYTKIEVYFTDAEYELFIARVRRTNLPISAFIRRMAADQVIRDTPYIDVPYLMRVMIARLIRRLAVGRRRRRRK